MARVSTIWFSAGALKPHRRFHRPIFRCYVGVMKTDGVDQRAFAILKLAQQGEAAIAAGQSISHAAHRARLANVLKSKVAKR